MMKINGGDAFSSHRIGWYDLYEDTIENISPYDNIYACGILSPRYIHSEYTLEWINQLNFYKCGVNLGYNINQNGLVVYSDRINQEYFRWSDSENTMIFAKEFQQMRHFFDKNLRNFSGKRRRVLIDATAISKIALSSIVGMLVRTRAVSGIDILYQQADYQYNGLWLHDVYAAGPLHHDINDIDFCFSAVPYSEGKYKPNLPRHIILLCGLDFQRTIAKIRELEPARIDLIIEDEAVRDSKSFASLQSLCRNLDIDPDGILKTKRWNLNETIKLIDLAISRINRTNIHSIIISAGGKPFATAATLHSILKSECPLLATVPDRVVHMQRMPLNKCKLYRLDDRTSV